MYYPVTEQHGFSTEPELRRLSLRSADDRSRSQVGLCRHCMSGIGGARAGGGVLHSLACSVTKRCAATSARKRAAASVDADRPVSSVRFRRPRCTVHSAAEERASGREGDDALRIGNVGTTVSSRKCAGVASWDALLTLTLVLESSWLSCMHSECVCKRNRARITLAFGARSGRSMVGHGRAGMLRKGIIIWANRLLAFPAFPAVLSIAFPCRHSVIPIVAYKYVWNLCCPHSGAFVQEIPSEHVPWK